MVRLSARSVNGTGLYAGDHSATTVNVINTAAQYAGNSRVTRDRKNAGTSRPQQLMQMTNPLIRKNSSTPSHPYEVTADSRGNASAGGAPQARVTAGVNAV